MAKVRNRIPREKKINLARAQRQAPIPAEKFLWKALRNRGFAGFKFRRQHPVGQYIVDFACVECSLIVELDGESHLSNKREDEKRTNRLEAEGWLVLRFWNTEVYDDLEAVNEMIYRTCAQRSSEGTPPSPPAPLPPPTPSLQTTGRTRRGERGARASIRLVAIIGALLVSVSVVHAQTGPSYAKQIRPFLTKYCLECHNARTQKGTLSLETFKAMMDGSDNGPVVVPGQPDKSKLVLLVEHKEKPTMPPSKAKFQPTKDEVALLRAWVKDRARDDGANVKVELPAIKAKVAVLPPVTALTYSPSGKFLYVARQEEIFIASFETEPPKTWVRSIKDEKSFIVQIPIGSVTGYATFPKYKWYGVTAISKPGEFGVLMDYGAMYPRIRAQKHKDAITDLILDPTGEWIASASYDTQIQLYEWRGKKSHLIKEHSDAVYGLAFNPRGKLLASVSADRAMKVFDVEKGKLLYTLGEATDWLYAVAWSPDGKYLVSGGVDKSIRVYEPTRTGAKLRQSVFAHEGAVQKLVFTSDSKTLYSVGEDRVVKAWDIEKMVERKVYDKQPETVLCLALREDAGQFIVGRYDGIVQLIDMKTGKVAHEFGKEKAKKAGQQSRAGSPPHSQLLSPEGAREEINGSSLAPSEKGKVGTLDRAGAVHVFRYEYGKGDSVGAHLTAEGKSKLEPILTLADKTGRVLAESTDGLLGHTFAEAGTYTFSVRDREFRGGADFKYRFRFGRIPIVNAVFPLGVQRGTKADIQLGGVFLPKRNISVTVPADAKVGQVMPLSVGAGILGKAQIVAGAFPDVASGSKIPVPGTANGRIARDNQQDVWSFPARKGQRLIVEVNARRIGSRLDSVIEILDKNDQPVPRAVLRPQAKTNVTFRDHDSAAAGIRIDAWPDLATNDLLYVGNELVKIQSLPTHPDADCNFFATDGRRIGYLDTTPTHHANGTPMYKVSVHPPGTSFPPNGFPVFTLYYKNDDGGPGYGRDSRIIFDPPADGEYKVRIGDARGTGGVNFGYRLTVREPRPGFNLRYSPTKPAVSKGGAIPITITAERIDGFDGPIAVRVKNLPPGLHLPETTIEAGTFTTAVALYADANTKLPARAPPAILEGSALANGISIQSASNFEMPTLIEPGDLVTTTVESEVSIRPGAQTKMLVKIERRNGFKGRVPLDVRGLPHGVRVLDIGLNGILVNENETARTVVIYAEPWVQPQEHPFVVLARREGKNTEHAAKSVLLRVK